MGFMALVPIFLAIAVGFRLIAYGFQRMPMILTWAIAYLALCALLRLPSARDGIDAYVYGMIGLGHFASAGSLFFGVLSSDRFARYANVKAQRCVQRRRLWLAVTLTTLGLSYLATNGRDEVVDIMQVDSPWMTVANGIVSTHVICAASMLAIASIRTCQGRCQHRFAMAGLVTGSIGGILFGAAVAGRKLIDIGNDLVILGIPYDGFLWLVFGPMCLVLGISCLVGPYKVTKVRLFTRQP